LPQLVIRGAPANCGARARLRTGRPPQELTLGPGPPINILGQRLSGPATFF